jgi:hypothetical protein
VVTAVLAYDEGKEISRPEALIKGCLDFATWTATEDSQEYFGAMANPQDAVKSAPAYLQEFLKHWSGWPKLEKEGRNAEIVDLICSMIHTTESNKPTEQADKQRLGPLALEIDCRLPTMRGAFVELFNK